LEFTISSKLIRMGSFTDLIVYQKAFSLAMEIFEISKRFPKEERYSLTDQIRRSSRFVCSNLAESYRKRLYPAHFMSKLTDSDMENSETDVWLQFSCAAKYITDEEMTSLQTKNGEVGKMLGYMIKNPEKYRK
jgi:four helix bundle protein